MCSMGIRAISCNKSIRRRLSPVIITDINYLRKRKRIKKKATCLAAGTLENVKVMTRCWVLCYSVCD